MAVSEIVKSRGKRSSNSVLIAAGVTLNRVLDPNPILNAGKSTAAGTAILKKSMNGRPAETESPLSDEEIEALLLQEGALAPESHEAVPQQALAQSSGRDMGWAKWLLIGVLVAEFIMFFTSR